MREKDMARVEEVDWDDENNRIIIAISFPKDKKLIKTIEKLNRFEEEYNNLLRGLEKKIKEIYSDVWVYSDWDITKEGCYKIKNKKICREEARKTMIEMRNKADEIAKKYEELLPELFDILIHFLTKTKNYVSGE